MNKHQWIYKEIRNQSDESAVAYALVGSNNEIIKFTVATDNKGVIISFLGRYLLDDLTYFRKLYKATKHTKLIHGL